QARNARLIGSSLQAHPVVCAPLDLVEALKGYDLADICITSDLTLSADPLSDEAFFVADDPDIRVLVRVADGQKCQRCWKVLPDVGQHSHPDVCARCDDVLVQAPVEPA
ncbi:MAG: isoleucine--tRNA ligase, partial [Euryarchaeota archaeon]|nr:isoleucine--tRNA ligase [Euryarchaeota archaeon]